MPLLSPGLIKANPNEYIIDGADVRASHHLDVRKFGAVAGGTQDATDAINSAIDSGEHVWIPPKLTFRVDGQLLVNGERHLEIGAGSTLKRFLDSECTDPVIWIRGSRAVVKGAGESSKIVTECLCPRGIVRLGYEEPGDQNPFIAISSNTLESLCLQGGRSMGRQDSKDVALWMCNTQDHGMVEDSGIPSYFNRIRHLWVSNVNYGIELLAWANANLMHSIMGFEVGDGLVFFHGGLDNVLNGTFLTNSIDASTLLFSNYVQSYGGVIPDHTYVPSYNICTGIAGEQGGSNANLVKEIGPSTCAGNMIVAMVNVNNGFSVLPGFFDRANSLIFGSGVFGLNVDAHTRVRTSELWHKSKTIIRADYDTFSSGTGLPKYSTEKHWIVDGLQENKSYKVLTLTIPSNIIACGTVTLDGAAIGGNGVQNAAHHGKWLIEKQFVGQTPVITGLDAVERHRATASVTHTEAQDVIDIVVAIPNNGTGQTLKGFLGASICGFNLAEDSLATFYDIGVEV